MAWSTKIILAGTPYGGVIGAAPDALFPRLVSFTIGLVTLAPTFFSRGFLLACPILPARCSRACHATFVPGTLSLAPTADECHGVDKGPSMSPLVCPNWRDSRKGPLSLTVPQGPWHQSWLCTRWTPPGLSSRFGSRTTACAMASQEWLLVGATGTWEGEFERTIIALANTHPRTEH